MRAPRSQQSSPASPRSIPGVGCLTLMLIAVAAAVALYATNWDWLSPSRLTLYQTVCRGELVFGQCEDGWERLPPTTFLVSVDQQSVVKQVAGLPPQRLLNCTVASKRNWRCTVAGTVSEGFTDGEYELVHEDSAGSIPIVLNGTSLVPRYQWLWASRPNP
jgi:hypothetical protein